MAYKKIQKRDRVFFAGEGISERNYGQIIRLIAEQQSIKIHVDCKAVTGGDPLDIVRESVKQYKRGVKNHAPYEHGVIMLDSDTLGKNINRDNQIPIILLNMDIDLIYNDPNFEAFILHHFDGHEHDNPPAVQSLNRLKTVFPNYEKNIDAKSLLDTFSIEGVSRACSVHPELRSFLEKLNIEI
jgi:hypothetical protein